MEETTILQTYLADFGAFYTSLRYAFWPILINGLIGFSIFGVIRGIIKYATASPIGEWDRGSYICRGTEYLAYTYFETPKEQKKYKDYDENHKYIGVKGGHILGTVADLAITAAITSLLIWIWPFILTVTILFGPIQLCRNHFMKKKQFIANLKGEELDI